MKTDNDLAPLAIPTALLAEIRATADEEHQPVGDVLKDVIERGLEERRWRRLLAYGAKQAERLGLTQADVARLIAESRGEQRHAQE